MANSDVEMEILSGTVVSDGSMFRVQISWTHVPFTAIPTAADFNAALDSVGAGMQVNALVQSGTDYVSSIGTSIYGGLECTLDDADGSATGAQIHAWVMAALVSMQDNWSIHLPTVDGINTMTANTSQAGGLLSGVTDAINKLGDSVGGAAAKAGDAAKPVLSTLTWIAIAVIAVVLFTSAHEVKNAVR